MAKMPLAWHKKNLAAVQAYHAREKQKLEDMQKQVDRILNDMVFLSAQCRAAEEAGKDGFDAEKYLKKKG